jgi:hypothetical protein
MKRILILTVLAHVAGCAPALLAQSTVGDGFRKVLADIDAYCKQHKLGPYLDRADPEFRNKAANTRCNILRLEPKDATAAKTIRTEGQQYPIPERWLDTPEGRFAHSIRLPAPHDLPKPVYREGMSGKEYFEALCREEAGTFVFKTVDNVAVVFEARPRNQARSEEFFHLYAMEDPYGYVHGETKKAIGATWTAGNRYQALERKVYDTYEHVFRTSISEREARTVSSPQTAQFGFVWRGISRPKDREHGIAGGELIVYDLKSGEVLGFRRGFAGTGVGYKGVSWEFAPVCPRFRLRGGRSKDFDFGLWFVSDVLRPHRYAAYREEIGSKKFIFWFGF